LTTIRGIDPNATTWNCPCEKCHKNDNDIDHHSVLRRNFCKRTKELTLKTMKVVTFAIFLVGICAPVLSGKLHANYCKQLNALFVKRFVIKSVKISFAKESSKAV